MNSLYLENSIIGSLFRFFSQYFSGATWPTQSLQGQLVIAQLALQTFHPLFSGSLGYQMWTKGRAKFELSGNLIEDVKPLLKDRQVLL